MLRFSIKRPSRSTLQKFEGQVRNKIERASLIAADKAAQGAKASLRRDFAAAGAGRLGLAIGAGSDGSEGHGVQRKGAGFRAGGWLFVRSRSERTQGAIEAYTEGGTISPVKGKWLWIATKAIPARVGKYRMTPDRYNKSGLVSSIGPLVFVPGKRGGEALLVVKNVTTRIEGRPNARRLPKSGRARAGRQAHDEIVAFIGIKQTRRTRLIDVDRHMVEQQHAIPKYFHEASK